MSDVVCVVVFFCCARAPQRSQGRRAGTRSRSRRCPRVRTASCGWSAEYETSRERRPRARACAPDWCVALSARQRLPIARSRRVASCRVASCRVVSLALCRVVLCFYDLLCSRRVRIWDSRFRRIVRVCSAASVALFSLPSPPLPPPCPYHLALTTLLSPFLSYPP